MAQLIEAISSCLLRHALEVTVQSNGPRWLWILLAKACLTWTRVWVSYQKSCLLGWVPLIGDERHLHSLLALT